MKTEIEINEEVDIDGERNGRQASFSQNKGLIFTLLEDQYARKEGAIVRELGSNARDAHRSAGVKRPIKMGFDYDDNGNYFFYVKDFGCGMDYNFIYDTYMDYGESTKTGSNDEIGMYGIGSKSPFTLFEQYYIISNVDGIKYQYLFFKSDDMIPDFEQLDKRETDDLNGTEVRMFISDIKKGESFYKFSFITAFKRELMYFPEILFSNTEEDNELINYKIYEFDNFYIRSDYDGQTNISNDGVCYPINNEILKLSKQLPIGLKFKTGDLRIQPSREVIRDDKREIIAIRNKYKASCYELINKWNNHDEFNILDLNEYYRKLGNDTFEIENVKIDISYVESSLLKNFSIKYKANKYKFKLFEDLEIDRYTPFDIENALGRMFKVRATISNGRFSTLENKLPSKSSIIDKIINFNTSNVYITTKEELKKDINKNKYINTGVIISLNKNYLQFIKGFDNLFERNYINFFKFRRARLIYKYFEKYINERTNSYDTVDVPLNLNVNLQLKDTFITYDERGRNRYSDVEYFVKNIKDSKRVNIVYFNNKDLRKIFYNLNRYRKSLYFIDLSKSNYELFKEYIKNDKRFMSQEELFEHKTFRDVCTAFYLKSVLEDHKKNGEPYTNYYSEKLLFICNSDIYNSYTNVLQYIKKYSSFMYGSSSINEIKEDFINDCISLGKKKRLINKEMINELKKVRNYFKGLDLLTYINIDHLETPKEQQQVINYIIAQKKRVNDEWYNILHKSWEVQFIKENYEKYNYLKSVNKLAA